MGYSRTLLAASLTALFATPVMAVDPYAKPDDSWIKGNEFHHSPG